MEDFGSLLVYLRAYPLDKLALFNSRISKPLRENRDTGLESLRKAVHAVTLRRSKNSILAELQLPDRMVQTHRVTLSPEERVNYEKLKKSFFLILSHESPAAKREFRPSCVFQTIARLRQFCDHGLDLLPNNLLEIFQNPLGPGKPAGDVFASANACAACKNTSGMAQNYLSLSTLDCGHGLCTNCEGKKRDEEDSGVSVCQVCESEAVDNEPMVKQLKTLYKPSSKVIALMENLKAEREKGADTPVKR